MLTLSRLLLGFLALLWSSAVGPSHLAPGIHLHHLHPDVGGLRGLDRTRRSSFLSLRGLLVVEMGCVRQVGSFGLRRWSSLWGEATRGARVHEIFRRRVVSSASIFVAGSSVGAAPAHRSAVWLFAMAVVLGVGVVWGFGPAPGRIWRNLRLLAFLGGLIRRRVWERHGLFEVMFEPDGGVQRRLSYECREVFVEGVEGVEVCNE